MVKRWEKAGWSLVETFLAMALFSVLLTLLWSILLPLIKAGQRGADQSDLRQTGAVALDAIAQQVEISSAPGLCLLQNAVPNVPVALSVHPVLDLTTSGATVWDSQVWVFYGDATRGALVVCTCPPAPAGQTYLPQQGRPFRWVASDFASFLSSGPTAKVLSKDLESWSVSGITDLGVRLPILLTVNLRRATAQGVQTFNLTRPVSPRVSSARS